MPEMTLNELYLLFADEPLRNPQPVDRDAVRALVEVLFACDVAEKRLARELDL